MNVQATGIAAAVTITFGTFLSRTERCIRNLDIDFTAICGEVSQAIG